MVIQHVPSHMFLKVLTSNDTKLQQLCFCSNYTALKTSSYSALKYIAQVFRFFPKRECFFFKTNKNCFNGSCISKIREYYLKNVFSDRKIVPSSKKSRSSYFLPIVIEDSMNNTKEVWRLFYYIHPTSLQLLTMIWWKYI